MTSLSLGEISLALGGKVAGDADIRVEKVGTLEGADSRAITFLTQARFLDALKATRAGAEPAFYSLQGQRITHRLDLAAIAAAKCQRND
jgi:hypothetical protein